MSFGHYICLSSLKALQLSNVLSRWFRPTIVPHIYSSQISLWNAATLWAETCTRRGAPVGAHSLCLFLTISLTETRYKPCQQANATAAIVLLFSPLIIAWNPAEESQSHTQTHLMSYPLGLSINEVGFLQIYHTDKSHKYYHPHTWIFSYLSKS